MIIAIDGPSGAGKGTLAKLLGEKLGFAVLETGLLYRAVAYKLMQSDDLDDLLTKARIISKTITTDDFKNKQVLKTESVGNVASSIASDPEVRKSLLDFQRNFAKRPPNKAKGAILDGRDIGTVVLPNADIKIFITATMEIRAKRRLKELQDNGINTTFDEVLHEMRVRDERDRTRVVSPLLPSDDAMVVDTSEMNIEEVLRLVMGHVAKYRAS